MGVLSGICRSTNGAELHPRVPDTWSHDRGTTLTIMLTALTIVSCLAGQAFAQTGELKFRDLPQDVRKHVSNIRASCNESGGNAGNVRYKMSGITVFDLEGDGSKDLMIDNEHLCNHMIPGANCSNRGCELLVWKQVGQGNWRKVFQHQLSGKFISIDRKSNRFQLIAASIYAGSAPCKPVAEEGYRSGETCDVLVRYQNGNWVWKKIEAVGGPVKSKKTVAKSSPKKCVGQYDWMGGPTTFSNQAGGYAAYTNCKAPEDSQISMRCLASKGGVDITLAADTGVRGGGRIKLRFRIGRRRFTRRGSTNWNEMTGESQPVLTLRKSDSLMGAFGDAREISIRIGRIRMKIPLKGAATAVDAMLHACGA